MAIIQSGATTDLLTVDPTMKAARVVIKPDEMLGAYQIGAYTGTIAATTAAGAAMFSMRWAPGNNNVCIIKRISAQIINNGAMTASQTVGLDLYVARSFTASDSGGTTITLTGNTNKYRTSMSTTGMADMRVATTTGLTAGTRTLDTNPIAKIQGWATITTAAGVIVPQTDLISYDPNDYPIVLAANEGIVATNSILLPAAGTLVFGINVEWFEASAY